MNDITRQTWNNDIATTGAGLSLEKGASWSDVYTFALYNHNQFHLK